MLNHKIIIGRIGKFDFSTEHYKILGLNRYATKDQIKQAFIELAKKHHPDVSDIQNNHFKEITNAYNILKDPIKKSQYDETLSKMNHQQQSSYQKTNQQKYRENNENQNYSQNERYNNTQMYQRQYKPTLTSINWIILSGVFLILVTYSFTQPNLFKPKVILPTELHIQEEVQQIFENKVQEEIEKLSQVLSQKDQPKTYEQLVDLKEQVDNIKSGYQSKQMSSSIVEQAQMEVIRNNLYLTGGFINDSPHVMEKRRKFFEEEMKQKKFKIEYETWERVSQGEVSKLVPRSQIKQNKKKKNTQDQSLEDYARAHKLKIHKIDRDYHKPQVIQLRQYEATQDQYM